MSSLLAGGYSVAELLQNGAYSIQEMAAAKVGVRAVIGAGIDAKGLLAGGQEIANRNIAPPFSK